MTIHALTKKKKLHTLSAGQLFFGFFILFCLLLILKNPEVAVSYMNRGLLLCAKTVIPSLFPFMVISDLIVRGGIGDLLLRRSCKPLRRLLGLSEAGCVAMLLGMLCGFPVGAKCTVLSYERGTLTREEAERLLCFSNNPSSAFLISAVGVSLWNSKPFGTALYATVLFASFLTALLTHLLQKKKHMQAPYAPFPTASASTLKGAKLFTESISSATGSMLLVCSYVVFFSALLGTLNIVLSTLGANTKISAVLFCLFELSGGVSQASALQNTTLAALLTAFAVGWSGLSVHCQILSVCDGKGLSLRPYFAAKLLQGALCVILFWLLLTLFPSLLVPMQKL
ncbi:MAG: hypothetical protein IJF33_00350 [Clostridia bacterium]|nr:hypothetical protein [Clostridia bacterium]